MSKYVVSVDSSSLIQNWSYIRDLFVFSVDSDRLEETFMRTKCFEPLQKQRGRC